VGPGTDFPAGTSPQLAPASPQAPVPSGVHCRASFPGWAPASASLRRAKRKWY